MLFQNHQTGPVTRINQKHSIQNEGALAFCTGGYCVICKAWW